MWLCDGTGSHMVLIDDIQDEVSAHELPIQFDDLVDLAIRVDNSTVLTVLLIWPHLGLGRAQISSLSPHPVSLVEPEPMQVGRTHLTAKEDCAFTVPDPYTLLLPVR